MQKLNKAIITLGIIAVLVSGSSSVFGKTQSTRERSVRGSIVSIDRAARTLTVREYNSDRTIQVRVPEGRYVRTGQAGLAFASFEQLLPGMTLNDVRVEY